MEDQYCLRVRTGVSPLERVSTDSVRERVYLLALLKSFSTLMSASLSWQPAGQLQSD